MTEKILFKNLGRREISESGIERQELASQEINFQYPGIYVKRMCRVHVL